MPILCFPFLIAYPPLSINCYFADYSLWLVSRFLDIDTQTSEEISLKPADAFGQSLKHFRARQQISQERLSQESSLDRSYISLLERGLRQPSLTTLLQISEALDVSASELILKVEELLNENHKG
jgi:DNA-binding XRE family transcriptional regulator